MKVIGVGFGRTGTASLRQALNDLGFGPCYHMFEVIEQPERARLWQAAADGSPVDWDEIFDGYQSTVDWPGARFWRELVAKYPDAKVILTVRDPKAWFASIEGTIFRLLQPAGGPERALATALSRLDPEGTGSARMARTIVVEQTFGGRTDARHTIEAFERHIQEVTDLVPAERLLVYDVKDGWPPLCAFLGVPTPDTRPFPHLNEAATMVRMMRGHMLRRLVRPATLGAAAKSLFVPRPRDGNRQP